ncbi:LppU/SCO3897 family protein [Phytohabitans rumicis]|uniref:Septum formation-related domain-containing protein n=1 Tax=Phytohabitans rumicis TaxID=1076125 RepID=A0A6V8L695_9ACTN|nr:hypothetical protein [Phytohabitans rumicis]GFJ89626.1 hypothetical protein Prum_032680 [Phytohabitans rumicis]
MTNQPPPPPAQAQGWGPATPPPPPNQGFGPAESAPVPAPPQKKGGAGKKIAGIGGGVVVAVIVAIVLAVLRNVLGGDDATAEAKQGDCIADLPSNIQEGQEVKADNAKVVDCASAEAKYSVVGRVDGVTAEQASAADSTVCNPYLEAGAESIYYAIPAGGKGYVLCLKPA